MEKKKNYSNYLNPLLAFFLGIFILGGLAWWTYYFKKEENKLKKEYSNIFNELKENKRKEVNSPIREIFTQISNNSDLVYGLSLFHENPVKIIDEVEKAIYIWRDKRKNYKIITNENLSFSNYNKITFGLISTKLEYYAELIKKLKKLYGNTFRIEGLKNFGIQRERNADWRFTGKVFFTTNITLTYLKWRETNNTNSENEEENINTISYEGNKESIETLDSLITQLAEKRKEEGKTELYFNSKTKDNAIYLGTDIEYNKINDIYYINKDNNLIDIFSLNKIGSKGDYDILKNENFKALLITKKDWTWYAVCTKVIKEESELNDKEKKIKEAKPDTEFTKIYEKGTFKLDNTLKTFCSLL